MSSADENTAPQEPDAMPDRCVLRHSVFNRLEGVTFRRAETDGTPVMVLPFGDREASVPLRSLQHEFGIGDDTPDGRMLGLIAASLDFVSALVPGDPLPAEIVSGQASWEPAAVHRQRAWNRLHRLLLDWLEPGGGTSLPDERFDSDPALRGRVQSAFGRAAEELDLPRPEDAVALVERLADEFAYIEALRERLLGGVLTMSATLERVARRLGRADGERREALTQVRRLLGTARGRFVARFEEIDAQTGEIIAALRNIESQLAYIRSSRDSLYRSQRAWAPLLAEWASIGLAADEALWSAIGRAYQFLARRYLPASEWPTVNSLRAGGGARKPANVMTW
jgi:hypothetical protein